MFAFFFLVGFPFIAAHESVARLMERGDRKSIANCATLGVEGGAERDESTHKSSSHKRNGSPPSSFFF